MLRDEVREPAGGGTAIGAAELARGLCYLRASNLQVMRLQLAAEQHDRRGVMAAIDELVGLDRELGRFIEAIPGQGGDAGEIEAQKREVMAGRLMLARGKIGPALTPEVPPDDAPPTPSPLGGGGRARGLGLTENSRTQHPLTPTLSPLGRGGREEAELLLDQPAGEEEWYEPEPAPRWPWVLSAVLLLAAAALAVFLFSEPLTLWWESLT